MVAGRAIADPFNRKPTHAAQAFNWAITADAVSRIDAHEFGLEKFSHEANCTLDPEESRPTPNPESGLFVQFRITFTAFDRADFRRFRLAAAGYTHAAGRRSAGVSRALRLSADRL